MFPLNGLYTERLAQKYKPVSSQVKPKGSASMEKRSPTLLEKVYELIQHKHHSERTEESYAL